MPARPPFELGADAVAAGTRRTIELPVSVLSDHTPVTLSVHVVHGKRPGPTVFVSAAVHGDEIIGVEIARRLLRAKQLDRLRGTLMVVPIVNSFGFHNRSRYLPDRRDLNRSFPGSPSGSLASRLAYIFLEQIVARSDLGIDLHSAAIHRTNQPQIRISPKNPRTRKLAAAFGAPIVLASKLRDGSLRQAAQNRGVDVLLYEAGEALRFDEIPVRIGVIGTLRVMRALEMLPSGGIPLPKRRPMHSHQSVWLRAPAGGLLRAFKTVGDVVTEGDVLGSVANPFGDVETAVVSPKSGLVVGRTNLPVVNEGDGLFHVAVLDRVDDPQDTIDSLNSQVEEEEMFDEDEII